MKKLTGSAAAAAAAVLLVLGGQAFSGERQDLKFPSADAYWQFEGPMATGNIPQGEDLSKVKTGIMDATPKVEYGGLVYRVGIDTH